MKKRIVLVIAILGFVVGSACAGGDQNREQHLGEVGQGAVVRAQICVNK
jgi:hypothetical protein